MAADGFSCACLPRGPHMAKNACSRDMAGTFSCAAHSNPFGSNQGLVNCLWKVLGICTMRVPAVAQGIAKRGRCHLRLVAKGDTCPNMAKHR